VGTSCQQVRQVLPRLCRAAGGPVSLSTVRRLLRRAGYSGKRMRRRLKAQRDPPAFAAGAHELAQLQAAEARGELAL